MNTVKELEGIERTLKAKDYEIKMLHDDVEKLQKALDIMLKVKTADSKPDGIELSLTDFLAVYNAMFTGDHEMVDSHIYGKDIRVSWNGLWCNCLDGAAACNYIIGGIEELAGEIEEEEA